MHLLCRHRAYAPETLDGKTGYKIQRLVRVDGTQSIRLAIVRSNLCQELIIRYTGGCYKIKFSLYLLFDFLGNVHVYADNDRVAKQVAALHDGDFDTFLCLVNESGRSSWEYLQNVIPAGYKEHQEVGVTIAAAKHLLGDKGAVRVHGGGFAGTVQAFVPVEMLDEFKAGMEAILGEGRCHVLSIRPEGGAVL